MTPSGRKSGRWISDRQRLPLALHQPSGPRHSISSLAGLGVALPSRGASSRGVDSRTSFTRVEASRYQLCKSPLFAKTRAQLCKTINAAVGADDPSVKLRSANAAESAVRAATPPGRRESPSTGSRVAHSSATGDRGAIPSGNCARATRFALSRVLKAEGVTPA